MTSRRIRRPDGADQGPVVLQMPPFPRLTWDNWAWEGSVTLPSWTGHRIAGRRGAATATSGRRSPRSTALSVVHPAGDGDVLRFAPSPEQRRAFAFLLEHEAAIAATAQRALLPYAKREIRYARHDFDDPGSEPGLRPLRSTADLRSVVELAVVHVLTESLHGVAYLGLQWRCTWDDEHDAGILLHRRRVVDLGHADTAFHGGTASADADRRSKRRG